MSTKIRYAPTTTEMLRNIINQKIRDYGLNANLNDIDVSNITNMSYLFASDYRSKFNGDISEWDVSNVTDMSQMFNFSDFNGDISNWDVSNVKDMHCMFDRSQFDGDISNWNVSNVKDMACMFKNNHNFDQDLSKWDVSGLVYKMSPYGFDSGTADMFKNSGMKHSLTAWRTKFNPEYKDELIKALSKHITI